MHWHIQMSPFVSALTAIFLSSYLHQADSACGGQLFALSLTNLSLSGATGDKFVIDQFFISSFRQTTYVKVEIPQLLSSTIVTLDATNGYHVDSIQWTFIGLDLTTPMPDQRYPMGIIISSSNASINVQVNKATTGSGGGFLAMPLYKKPDTVYNYYVPSYNCNPSVLTIVAVQNDTCVSVEQYYNDSTGVLSMRKLQSMTMQAGEVSNLYSSGTDYTGVLVATRKPVSVFGGCSCTQIPAGKAGCDYIIEQVPEASNILSPNNATSTKYILGSVAGRPLADGFYYRIIAAPTVSNFVTVATVTELRYSSIPGTPTSVASTPAFNGPVKLYRGQFLEFAAGFGFAGHTVVVVECQIDACEVVQYNPSDTVSSATPVKISDPFMVLVPPVAYYTRDITFSTSSIYDSAGLSFPGSSARNFLTIVAKCAVSQTLTLDQTPVVSVSGFSGWITLNQPGFSDYCISWIQTEISDGYHTLTTTGTTITDQQLYTAFVYGHGNTQSSPETAYGYLAGYDNRAALPYTLLPGPWYDINPNMVGVAADTTAAPPTTTPPGVSPAVLPDDLPSYSLVWVAEFKALDPGYVGKTPDYHCSNGYFGYFKLRIQELQQHLSVQCSDNVLVTVDVNNADYYSEYSLSKGKFKVTIQGNGTATLGDVNSCALKLEMWIRDPANWITGDPDGTQYSILSFLRNNDAMRYSNLTDCAAMYLSNSQGKLSLYAFGWVCPSTTGAIYGSASALLFDGRVTAIALAIACLLQVLLNRRR